MIKRHLLPALSALLVLLAAPLATADSVAFSITTFHSFATITPESVSVTVCPHSDGTYTNVHVMGSGPVSSNDPRMSGIFHVDAMILTNAVGVGVSRDKWTITDAVTGAVKAKGVAQALDTDMTAPVHSAVTARLADGSFMSTLAVVTLPSAATGGLITVEYGGPVATDPGRGVIISRDCGGYFAADRRGYRAIRDNDNDD